MIDRLLLLLSIGVRTAVVVVLHLVLFLLLTRARRLPRAIIPYCKNILGLHISYRHPPQPLPSSLIFLTMVVWVVSVMMMVTTNSPFSGNSVVIECVQIMHILCLTYNVIPALYASLLALISPVMRFAVVAVMYGDGDGDGYDISMIIVAVSLVFTTYIVSYLMRNSVHRGDEALQNSRRQAKSDMINTIGVLNESIPIHEYAVISRNAILKYGLSSNTPQVRIHEPVVVVCR